MKHERETPYQPPSTEHAPSTTLAPRPWLQGLAASLVVVPVSTLIAFGFLFYRHIEHQREMHDFDMPPEMLSDMSIFGVGDLMPFAFWSIGLAIALFVLVASLSRLAFRFHVLIRSVLWAIVGAVTGFSWTFAVATMLGPWMGAFSFPTLYCWIGGAIVAVSASQAVPAVRRGV